MLPAAIEMMDNLAISGGAAVHANYRIAARCCWWNWMVR